VVRAELWKLGQLSPGNTVRFCPVTLQAANAMALVQDALLAGRDDDTAANVAPDASQATDALVLPNEAVLLRQSAPDGGVDLVFRRSGDCNVLIEFGELTLDLTLRFHVHALMTRLQGFRSSGALKGIIDLTPGIRSLQVHYDPLVISLPELMQILVDANPGHSDAADADIAVPSRTVWLPLSWDDAATRLAIEKYMQSVRADAPWCPSNIEFIRRMNGLVD
jgi:urea carboxylase